MDLTSNLFNYISIVYISIVFISLIFLLIFYKYFNIKYDHLKIKDYIDLFSVVQNNLEPIDQIGLLIERSKKNYALLYTPKDRYKCLMIDNQYNNKFKYLETELKIYELDCNFHIGKRLWTINIDYFFNKYDEYDTHAHYLIVNVNSQVDKIYSHKQNESIKPIKEEVNYLLLDFTFENNN